MFMTETIGGMLFCENTVSVQEGWVAGCGNKDKKAGWRQQEKETVMIEGDWGTEAHPHGLDW